MIPDASENRIPQKLRCPNRKGLEEYHALSQRLLLSANSEISQVNFLSECITALLEYVECDVIELRVGKGRHYFWCEGIRGNDKSVEAEIKCITDRDDGKTDTASVNSDATEQHHRPSDCEYPSRLSVPLVIKDKPIGEICLKSHGEAFFHGMDCRHFENVAQMVGIALTSQRTRISLRERVKELTCLYRLSQLMEQSELSLKDVLQRVATLLPPAWQYPELAAARIVFDEKCFATSGFDECQSKQNSPLIVKKEIRGCIEVGYFSETPEFDEGPFLKDERDLLELVSRQVSSMIERQEEAEDRKRLQVQLRHADRLATIGQLSAGVAHELNEPLGNILAFAQLALKESELLPSTARDLDKIVTASLHAREIIKKLMFFARQMPTRKSRVNLNDIIDDGLFFLESRCAKDGVSILCDLSPDLPDIVADPSQLNQVLVNLVVNAIQAMPDGGVLKISTQGAGNDVLLIIEDNGIGMTPEVLRQIFVPFFTTKDIHQGTGLGLPVVHGIVTSHGGTIEVESTLGKGSKFEVRLPINIVENGLE